jgi:hypothetical protein
MKINPKNPGHFVCGTLSVFSRLSLFTENQPGQKSAVIDTCLCCPSRVFPVAIVTGGHCYRRPLLTAAIVDGGHC